MTDLPINQIVNADCLSLMAQWPDSCVDAIVTDPPYGIGYKSSRKTKVNGEARRNDPSFGADILNTSWLPDAFRLLRDNLCFYCFTRWDVMAVWTAAVKAAGFKVRQRLVWNKCHWKMGNLMYYGSQTEDVIFATKGTPQLHWEHRRGNLLTASSAFLPEGQCNHPTQKPLSVVKQFILDATLPGDLILDPFCGSGTTCVAAQQLGRRFIGIDISEDYCNIARARLKPEPLFAEAV